MALKHQPKLDGTYGKPIQVDESYFSGRRKNRRGRILRGDCSSRSNESPSDDNDYEFDWTEEVPTPNSEEAVPRSERNYGRRTNGLWVVGIYRDADNVRFVEVPNRTGETLIDGIKEHVTEGSVIVTDE